MGNKASKVSQGGRILAKQTTAKPSAKPTRPTVQERDHLEEVDEINEETVAERLKKLGQVQFKSAATNYKPASEDKFTLTLEARQKLEEEGKTELEQGGPRKLLPATTITAILSSLKDGDSPESVVKSFNLDSSVLPKLEYLSIPQNPRKDDQPNQLLEDQGNKPRQPVRRRRKEP